MYNWRDVIKKLGEADTDASSEDFVSGVSVSKQHSPVVWLLGKTGAGKSSLVQNLTGLDEAVIGNGYEPCTRTSMEFAFPPSEPLMRFLDTRGIGEIDYDPDEDLKQCMNRSHTVLVLARVDDQVQMPVATALKSIVDKSPKTSIAVIHTGIDLVHEETQLSRARASNQALFEAQVGGALPNIAMAMKEGEHASLMDQGYDALMSLLADTMPEVVLMLRGEEWQSEENQSYGRLRSTVLRYASAAAAADLAPALGAIAVPSIQAAMLRQLSQNFSVAWSRENLNGFLAALGFGTLVRFGGSFLSRQLSKLIPGYGQTIGAISAGTLSFTATYALGRAAAFYLYQINNGNRVDTDELRQVYKRAFSQARRPKAGASHSASLEEK